MYGNQYASKFTSIFFIYEDLIHFIYTKVNRILNTYLQDVIRANNAFTKRILLALLIRRQREFQDFDEMPETLYKWSIPDLIIFNIIIFLFFVL